MNNLKTAVLLIGLSALLVWLGGLIGGAVGAQIALVLALFMNFGAYWWSDQLVLRMYRAQPVTRAEAPELVRAVEELVERAQIPMPKVYIIPGPALNAFATGRSPNHAAVAVTEGLLQHMSRSEVAAVLAHELSHIAHRDILIGTIAATLVGAITMLGQFAQWNALFGGYGDREEGSHPLLGLAFAMLAGVGASLIQLAISRSREYEADAGAARLMGDVQPMISALRKLEMGAERIPLAASEASAHLFIVSPLRGRGMQSWFSTHPQIADRIARLQELDVRAPSRFEVLGGSYS